MMIDLRIYAALDLNESIWLQIYERTELYSSFMNDVPQVSHKNKHIHILMKFILIYTAILFSRNL